MQLRLYILAQAGQNTTQTQEVQVLSLKSGKCCHGWSTLNSLTPSQEGQWKKQALFLILTSFFLAIHSVNQNYALNCAHP